MYDDYGSPLPLRALRHAKRPASRLAQLLWFLVLVGACCGALWLVPALAGAP